MKPVKKFRWDHSINTALQSVNKSWHFKLTKHLRMTILFSSFAAHWDNFQKIQSILQSLKASPQKDDFITLNIKTAITPTFYFLNVTEIWKIFPVAFMSLFAPARFSPLFKEDFIILNFSILYLHQHNFLLIKCVHISDNLITHLNSSVRSSLIT